MAEERFTVTVRAFNADGYHRDILIMDERQVWNQDAKITDPKDSMLSGLLGHGGRIVPSDFPEMTHFEVVLTRDKVAR